MIRDSEDWVTCGKSIKKLIEELQTIENQNLEVRISVDGGENHKPISIVGKEGDDGNVVCVLKYCGD